jgi:hypothetical protein
MYKFYLICIAFPTIFPLPVKATEHHPNRVGNQILFESKRTGLEQLNRRRANANRQQISWLRVLVTLIPFFALISPLRAVAVCFPGDILPPSLEINSPERAAFIVSASETVTVQGMASDLLSPIVSLVVNGQELLGSPGSMNETISTSITAPWGLSIITASATDECGNTAEVAQAFIRSDAYYAATTWADPTATVTEGIAAHFNQPAVDDQDRETNDDFASILQSVLADSDYEAVLNNAIPLTLIQDKSAANRSCDFFNPWVEDYYVVTRGPLSLSPVTIDILRTDTGKLDSQLFSDGVSGPLSADLRIYTCALGVKTNIKVTPSGSLALVGTTVTADMELSVASGKAEASVSNIQTGITSIQLNLDCGIAQSICDYLLPLVSSLLADPVNDLLSSIPTDLGVDFEKVINGYVPSQDIELPPPFNTTLSVASDIATTSITGPAGGGAIDLGFNFQVFPNERGVTIPPGAPGAPRHEAAGAVFENQGYDLGFGFKDDALNQLLWATWYGGGLEGLDLTGQIESQDLPVDTLALSFALPPVIMPEGTPDRVQVVLGDVATVATMRLPQPGQVTVEAFVSAVFEGVLEVDATRQALGFRVETTTVVTEITSSAIPPGALGVVQASLEDAFAQVGPDLVGTLIGGLAIPTLDLHSVAPGTFAQGEIVGIFGASANRPNDAVTRITGFTEADFDSDGDGAVDSGDNCIDTPNNDQSDIDSDGFGNVCDNCVEVSNGDQRDSNGDGYGNICDPDLDNNGIIQASDLAIFKPLFFTGDPDADFDGNGVVNAADLAIMKNMFFLPPGPSGLVP